MDLEREIGASLSRAITGQLANRLPANTAAYDAYLRGRYFWNQRSEPGFHKAIEYLNQAIQQDPAYAAAYAGLADCYLLLGESGTLPVADAYSRARGAAGKALNLDEKLAEPHASLAALNANEGNAKNAESEFRQAIAPTTSSKRTATIQPAAESKATAWRAKFCRVP
jgi:tetratricopeptide (TPR) repeat protein